MVYSTCSILAEENEELLKRVVGPAGGEVIPAEEGWLSELALLPSKLPGTVVVAPNELYEGFFAAKIRKKPGKK